MGCDKLGLLDKEGWGQIYTIGCAPKICSDHSYDSPIYADILPDAATLCGEQNLKLGLVTESGFSKDND